MSIALPAKPGIKSARLRLLDWNEQLKPILGGVTQIVQRLGTRSSYEFTLPLMSAEPLGRLWASRLRQAKLYGALMPLVQDQFEIGTPGLVVVDGDGQTGSTLNVRGGNAYYAVREGQAFSIVHNGVRYVHYATADVKLSGAGAAALPIVPMLRFITIDGETCEFGQPMIEGTISGNELTWEVMTAPYVNFGTIRLDENG